jgi:hypothetical protein
LRALVFFIFDAQHTSLVWFYSFVLSNFTYICMLKVYSILV